MTVFDFSNYRVFSYWEHHSNLYVCGRNVIHISINLGTVSMEADVVRESQDTEQRYHYCKQKWFIGIFGNENTGTNQYHTFRVFRQNFGDNYLPCSYDTKISAKDFQILTWFICANSWPVQLVLKQTTGGRYLLAHCLVLGIVQSLLTCIYHIPHALRVAEVFCNRYYRQFIMQSLVSDKNMYIRSGPKNRPPELLVIYHIVKQAGNVRN